jgi:hypothetical protein
MGGHARSGWQLMDAGNSFGARSACFDAPRRQSARTWKMVGRPSYLPASVPLGLSVG